MRFLSVGILFILATAFNVNAASISTFDNGGGGFALAANSEIIFDTELVDTTATEDDFIHQYLIIVSEELETVSAAITFASTSITNAVLSILSIGTGLLGADELVATTSVTAGEEATLSYLMTSPPSQYWIQFSGTLVDAIDSYQIKISAVPLPAAVWLFGSAIIGMIGFGRRKGMKGNAVVA